MLYNNIKVREEGLPIYQYTLWDFPGSREYDFVFNGKYGAPGEKREKRKKATPEQMCRQNQYNKRVRVRRLIKANFTDEDYWITLKYPKGTRKPLEDVQKDIRTWIRKMRDAYRRNGEELKWILRLEIGSQGGIHAHMIVNHSEKDTFSKMARDFWKCGSIQFSLLYESDDYDQLASYITKEPDEQIEGQLSFFPPAERKVLIKYSSSKNLIRPQPKKTRTCSHWTMRSILINGPKPKKGYYIDLDSIRTGVNPFTGRSYLHYTEIKIRSEGRHGKYLHRDGP